MKFAPSRYILLTLLIGFFGFAGPTPPPPAADPGPPGYPINDYIGSFLLLGVFFAFLFFKNNLKNQKQ